MEINKEKFLQQKDNKSSYIALLENRLDNTWGLEYISTSQFKIFPIQPTQRSFDFTELSEYGFTQIEDNDYFPKGSDKVIRTKIDGRIYEETNEWTVDVTTTGIDITNKTCGIVDNIAKTNERFYFLWAFADDSEHVQNSENIQDTTINYKPFKGFGLTKQPRTTSSAVSGATKGSVGTFTVTNAFQFTIGSTVVIWYDTTEYNRGTINAITDNNTLEIYIYNDSTYGTNITSAVVDITQVNDFKPYVVGDGGQTEYSNHYKLMTGTVYIDSEGVLRQFHYSKGTTYHPEHIAINNIPFNSGTYPISPYAYVTPTAFQCIFRTETSNKNVQFRFINHNCVIFEFISELLSSIRFVEGLLFKMYVASNNTYITLKIDGFVEKLY